MPKFFQFCPNHLTCSVFIFFILAHFASFYVTLLALRFAKISLRGFILLHLASFGFIWLHLASFGFIWLHLGFIWLHLGFFGLHLASFGLLLASFGFIWASFGRAAGAPNCDAPLLQDRPRTSTSNRRQADHSLGVPLLQQDLICAHRAGNTNLESPAGGSQPGRTRPSLRPNLRALIYRAENTDLRSPTGGS